MQSLWTQIAGDDFACIDFFFFGFSKCILILFQQFYLLIFHTLRVLQIV